MAHVPELRLHDPKLVAPLAKVTVPVAAEGETFTVSSTLLPEAVPATGMAAPFTVAASVVVVVPVMVSVTAEEVLGSLVVLPP
jgi:hypothetical protein